MLKKLLLLSCLISISAMVSAGGRTDSGFIGSTGSGQFYRSFCGFNCMVFYVNPKPTGENACNYSGGWQFGIDLDSPEGPTLVSMVLAAHAAGKKIGVKGNGVCSSKGVEQVEYIFTFP